MRLMGQAQWGKDNELLTVISGIVLMIDKSLKAGIKRFPSVSHCVFFNYLKQGLTINEIY